MLRLLDETRKFREVALDRKNHVIVDSDQLADQLKSELAKREHVLNPLETKKLRQERAKHRDRWRKITGSRRPK